jgi:hypothetical protein
VWSSVPLLVEQLRSQQAIWAALSYGPVSELCVVLTVPADALENRKALNPALPNYALLAAPGPTDGFRAQGTVAVAKVPLEELGSGLVSQCFVAAMREGLLADRPNILPPSWLPVDPSEPSKLEALYSIPPAPGGACQLPPLTVQLGEPRQKTGTPADARVSAP